MRFKVFFKLSVAVAWAALLFAGDTSLAQNKPAPLSITVYQTPT
jgi:hypothetical protein